MKIYFVTLFVYLAKKIKCELAQNRNATQCFEYSFNH